MTDGEQIGAESGGWESAKALGELSALVESLCVRCEALAREGRKLRAENRRLRDRGESAKARLERLLLTLPKD